jgi:hypothetical protein
MEEEVVEGDELHNLGMDDMAQIGRWSLAKGTLHNLGMDDMAQRRGGWSLAW